MRDVAVFHRCSTCHTRIKAVAGFWSKLRLALLPITALAIFCIFLATTQIHNFVVFTLTVGAILAGQFVWIVVVTCLAYRLAPPRIERDAGDPIRLNLSGRQ